METGPNSEVTFRSKEGKQEQNTGAPNENIVQRHLNIALLNVF